MLTRDDLARRFCIGKGVEVGPGMRPTRVGSGSSLSFVDKRSPGELNEYFGSVDVVTGPRLEVYEPRSFDFLIAHHVLEHSSNVLEELINWMSYVRSGGVIFISVPDKLNSPDMPRLETPPTHFIFDYLMGIDDSSFESREHIYSFLWAWTEVGGLAGKTKQEARELVFMAGHNPINDLHWHVFTGVTLKFAIETAARLSGSVAHVLHANRGEPQTPEHRIVVMLSKATKQDDKVARLGKLKKVLAPMVMEFCLKALEGQPLYSLSEIDKDKIMVADRGKARWVREPQTLTDRGIDNVPAIYFEFGRARPAAVGPDLASATFSVTSESREAVSAASNGRAKLNPGSTPLIGTNEGHVGHCGRVEMCGPIWTSFVQEVNDRRLSVLEVGSRRSVMGAPSKRSMFPNVESYTGVDYHGGEDVDIVGDVHRLTSLLDGRRVDAVHSHAVLEHLAMPWVAAVEMIRVLNVGGIMFHHVPFSWPMHELPWDFWRFTTEAFGVLFARSMGMKIEAIGFDDPLHMHMDNPTPAQASFHEVQSFGFFGAKLRKVFEADLSKFQWPVTLPELLGEGSHYPPPRMRIPTIADRHSD